MLNPDKTLDLWAPAVGCVKKRTRYFKETLALLDYHFYWSEFPTHINTNDNPEELRFLCDNAFFDNPSLQSPAPCWEEIQKALSEKTYLVNFIPEKGLTGKAIGLCPPVGLE